jgi:hypothetical protein
VLFGVWQVRSLVVVRIHRRPVACGGEAGLAGEWGTCSDPASPMNGRCIPLLQGLQPWGRRAFATLSERERLWRAGGDGSIAHDVQHVVGAVPLSAILLQQRAGS